MDFLFIRIFLSGLRWLNTVENSVRGVRKLKVALNPMYRIFLNFAKSCVLSCLSKVDNIKNTHGAVFELQAPKAVIEGVFKRSYRCYGNLCQKNDDN